VAIGAVWISACSVADVKLTNTPVSAISGKAGSFDVIQIDQQNHRLYVSDRTDKGIDVFDISSARATFLQTIAMTSSPNGLAIAPDLGRLDAGTSKGSMVFVDIDPKSPTVYTVLSEAPTGGKGADLLEYAPGKNLVFVASGSDGAGLSRMDVDMGFLPQKDGACLSAWRRAGRGRRERDVRVREQQPLRAHLRVPGGHVQESPPARPGRGPWPTRGGSAAPGPGGKTANMPIEVLQVLGSHSDLGF